MIVKVDKFQEVCKKILNAVDTTMATTVSDTLELKVDSGILFLNVTNKEYYVSVRADIDVAETFHAVVDAKLFLNLVSKITTPTLEMTTTDAVLTLKANGTYKIPLAFEGASLTVLPLIKINNVTTEMTVPNSAFQDILKYNTKELLKSGKAKPVHQLFYVDNKGAITFKGGACVTKFELERPVIMTFTEKVVKLFKLFKDEVLSLTLGSDLTASGDFQTKVMIKDSDVVLTAILPSDSALIRTFPVERIRERAYAEYVNSVSIDKNSLLSALVRLSLFSSKTDLYNVSHITFKNDGLSIMDTRKENTEEISYINQLALDAPYEASFNADDLKLTLETSDEQYVTISFGNKQAIVLSRGNVRNVVPEVVTKSVQGE